MFSLDENQMSNKTELQLVFHTNIQHGSHQLVLGDQTGSFLFVRLEVTVCQRLADQLKGHWDGDLSNLIQTVEQIEALHRSAFAVIIMPAHHLVFVRVGLFLDGVVKDQDRILPFHLANRWFDFLPQVF
jgi:hypothetical protein